MTTSRSLVTVVALAAAMAAGTTLSAQRSRGQSRVESQLTGTYELQATRGGDPQRAAQAATRSLPPGQRDRAYQNLLARLQPPHMLSIDRRDQAITIESSLGPRSSFDADGRSRNERGPGNRSINSRAELRGNRLIVTVDGGDRGSNLSLTFEGSNNGATLLVTRRLDDDDLQQPVTFQSYYQRTAGAAQWNLYQDDGRGSSYGPDPNIGMPDGTRLVATLDTPVSMRSSRSGEPFTMTVQRPAEYQGARISGVVARDVGYQGGRSATDLQFDFQAIDWRGRSMPFDALLNTIEMGGGGVLRVHDDGDVRTYDDRGANRDTTVQNGAIGAALGAIVGAIAGGGKGAAIGAIVGGSGGVILSQGHEQLELQRGAAVTLTVFNRR
jgi:hypothetical protein